MNLDDLRYELADQLYRAEGRWGVLEGEVRHLPDLDDPGALAAWAAKFADVKAEGARQLEWIDSLRAEQWRIALDLTDRLAEFVGALLRTDTDLCPPSAECVEHAAVEQGRAA